MKPTLPLALLALTVPALAQSTIERTTSTQTSSTQHYFDNIQRTLDIFTNDCAVGCGGFGAGASLSSPDPGLDGVEICRVQLHALNRLDVSFTVEATDPTGTTFNVFAQGEATVFGGASGSTYWLTEVDGSYGVNSGSGTGYLMPGERSTFTYSRTNANAQGEAAMLADLDPTSPDWSDVLNSASSSGGVSSGEVIVSPIPSHSGFATLELIEAEATARVELKATATFHLAEVPLLQTCTPRANGSGGVGEIKAYGSKRAGTNWLTVRATGLPLNQASLLFVGTAPAFVPFAEFDLCVGGSMTREGGVQFTDSFGSSDHEVSLERFQPGTTIYLQVIHRDPVTDIGSTMAGAFFTE